VTVEKTRKAKLYALGNTSNRSQASPFLINNFQQISKTNFCNRTYHVNSEFKKLLQILFCNTSGTKWSYYKYTNSYTHIFGHRIDFKSSKLYSDFL